MKLLTRSMILRGITEQAFNEWKHHPVTKLFMKFLQDYELQLAEHQVGKLRSSVKTPDPFELGTFTGQINAVQQMTNVSFADIVDAYPPDEEEEGSE